jgi:DNA-binding NarL/FixJ family response regulator
MIRLLIADDHEVIRFGLQMLLGDETDLTVIGMAADGGTAVTMAVADLPDVVVMDLAMPVLGGIAATRAIMLAAPSVRVLVHTAYSDASIVRQAFAAGACGYVLKDSSPATLLDAIRAVHRGESPMAMEAKRALGVPVAQ